MSQNVSGFVADGWSDVAEAFAHNIDSREDIGAGVSVFHKGKCVVDIAGGYFDKEATKPYTLDTLQLVFSTTKGVVATAVAMCVERGLLSYEEPVSLFWPAFAAHGKENVTVAQLLSHQAGLYTVDGPLTFEEVLDWNTMVTRLANTVPLFPVGSTHGYHALTFGWLAGHLVRLVDGRSIGAFVQEEIAGPLGIEFYIGLPADEQSRVARLMAHPLPKLPPEEALLLFEQSGPGTNGAQALSLNGAFREGAFNREDVRAAELAGANGITTARGLATVYAHLLPSRPGVQLLSEDVLATATRTVTRPGEKDAVLVTPTTFGMGFMTHGEHSRFAGPGSFGHSGAGGSFGFAQPAHDLAMAYVMNTMMTVYDEDPRRARLIAAAKHGGDVAEANA